MDGVEVAADGESRGERPGRSLIAYATTISDVRMGNAAELTGGTPARLGAGAAAAAAVDLVVADFFAGRVACLPCEDEAVDWAPCWRGSADEDLV